MNISRHYRFITYKLYLQTILQHYKCALKSLKAFSYIKLLVDLEEYLLNNSLKEITNLSLKLRKAYK